ncbi:uncharacterized protein [Spinacia oleracea]|uniref:Uncharacterized protein n=1 Tax=Spinacia oleracea TaxID=3562 RepID=A0ABM3RT06_SPIOL|nr:uncharacterized protein LOC130472242 [Spinacia oleracea]
MKIEDVPIVNEFMDVFPSEIAESQKPSSLLSSNSREKQANSLCFSHRRPPCCCPSRRRPTTSDAPPPSRATFLAGNFFFLLFSFGFPSPFRSLLLNACVHLLRQPPAPRRCRQPTSTGRWPLPFSFAKHQHSSFSFSSACVSSCLHHQPPSVTLLRHHPSPRCHCGIAVLLHQPPSALPPFTFWRRILFRRLLKVLKWPISCLCKSLRINKRCPSTGLKMMHHWDRD